MWESAQLRDERSSAKTGITTGLSGPARRRPLSLGVGQQRSVDRAPLPAEGTPQHPLVITSRYGEPSARPESRTLKLSRREHARLAQRLTSSLSQEADADAERVWPQEGERRLGEVKFRRLSNRVLFVRALPLADRGLAFWPTSATEVPTMTNGRRELNIAAVGDYLKESFPGDEVLDADEFDRDCRFYRISRGTALAHRVRVAHGFLDDHSPEVIVAKLRGWNAAGVIKAAGARLVLIGEGGLKVVPS